MFDKIAIIGDADIVYAFQAMGIQVYSPVDIHETRKIVRFLEKEEISLCFVQEGLLENLEDEREDLEKKFCPVLVGYSDYRSIISMLGKMTKEMAVRATGSDSFMKKRGNDETR